MVDKLPVVYPRPRFTVGWMTLFSTTAGSGCPGYLLDIHLIAQRLIKGRALARPSERSERFEPLVRGNLVRFINNLKIRAKLCLKIR